MKTQGNSFPPTRWTLIQAVQQGTPAEAAGAMEAICKNYWFPIYAYLRRSGRPPHDAEDITQALFQRLIADPDILRGVHQERGRLRSFLLSVLVRLLSDLGRHDRALKRGGGARVISFDEMAAEERYAREPQDVRDPEKLYLRAWAGGLLRDVQGRFRKTFEDKGRVEMFDLLEPFLGNDEKQPPYDDLAARMGSTPGAVRLLAHRLRKKFREALEDEIAKTVLTAEDLQEELAWLRQIMMEGS